MRPTHITPTTSSGNTTFFVRGYVLQFFTQPLTTILSTLFLLTVLVPFIGYISPSKVLDNIAHGPKVQFKRLAHHSYSSIYFARFDFLSRLSPI